MDNNGSRTLRSVRPQEPIRLPEKKQGKPVFWWIFGGVFVLLFIALGVFLYILNSFLAAYEASQPIHEAQALFDRCFTGDDFSEAFRLCGFEVEGFEDAATVSAALREEGVGKDLVFYQIKAEEGKARFNVIYADPVEEEVDTQEGSISHRSAASKLATMTFVQTDEDLGFGFCGWKYESLEMELHGSESVTVTVPRGTSLTLNGRSVSEDYIVSSEESPYNDFLPEGTPGIIWDEYYVDGLYRAGQVSCVDGDGKAMSLTKDEDGTYRAELNYRTDLQAEHADFVRCGMEAYARYIQDAGGIGPVANYFDTSSLFYKNTRLNPQIWVITPSSCNFENETVDHFYAYSDDVISCRVDMVQVLVRGGSEYRDHMVMTVFLRKVNGTFRIYDRMTENL